MRESIIEQHFVWAVQKLGGTTDKFRSLTRRGVADRIAYLPDGPVWFVELKAPRGRLSPLQVAYAEERQRMGQNYVVLLSKDDVMHWYNARLQA